MTNNEETTMLQKTGCELIAAERQRQQEVEGWTPEHDDEHGDGALARAASCYAYFAGDMGPRDATRSLHWDNGTGAPVRWPWDSEWWKPGKGDTNAERIRELTKAGALIAAEIDRLARIQEGNSRGE